MEQGFACDASQETRRQATCLRGESDRPLPLRSERLSGPWIEFETPEGALLRVCPGQHLVCRHPLCELWFGVPRVSFAAVQIARHDPRFRECEVQDAIPVEFICPVVPRPTDICVSGVELIIFPPRMPLGGNSQAEVPDKPDSPPSEFVSRQHPCQEPSACLFLNNDEIAVLGALGCALAGVWRHAAARVPA